tara:strand:- start:11 stop:3112 length:3102 start_codon:yes stop_codon:yes gene_type:complete
MASELLKNRAVINSLKEGDVPRVNFDLESTGFELLLPQPKPQAELDRIRDENFAKAKPFLMDESVDFIERTQFFKGSPGVVGSIQPMRSTVTGKINGYNIDFKIPGGKGERPNLGKTYFGVREFGTLEAAKKAAEARYKEIIEDPKFKNLLDIQGSKTGIRRETVVKSFLNYLENNGEFDGYEKLADELKPYRYDNIDRVYQLINKDFQEWKDGKFEVEGIDRKNLSANAKQEIKNWSPKARGERTNIKQKQLQFLDNLNNEDLPLKAVKQAFKKEFGKGKFYNEKTFGQRANQLTQLKKEGALPSNADGSKTLNYGILAGDRAAWLKKALSESVSFGNNYNRLIRASDVLESKGKIKESKRLIDAANKFFGKDGILTKLPGQAEHPLSVSYGGTDNLLKVDSLVKGDLNQLKKVVFDTPIKNLTGEYNKATTTLKRKNEIKTLINNRKNFMNYLTSGSFDKGIVAPVDFNFTDTKVVATANIKAIDELEDSYDFGKFVAKGDEYSKIFKQTGKELDLITKGGFAKRTAISDKRIADILSGEKFQKLGKKKLTAIEELMRPGASLGADPIKMGKVLAEDALKIGGRTIRGAATLGDALISVGKGAGGFGIGAMIEANPIITGGTEGKSFTQAGRDTIIGSLIDLIPGVDLGSLETDALKYADTEEEKIGMQNLIDYKNDYDRLQKDINAFKSYQTVPDFELEGTGIDLAQMQIDLAARYKDLTERAPKVYNPDVARIINELSLDLAEERKDRLEGIYGLIFGSRQMKADPEAFVLDQATDISQAIMGLEPVNKNLQQLENQLSPEEIEADFDMSGVMAAEGGRIGFAEGPKNPKRRLFLKIMGGIVSLPIFPSFLKKTEEAAQVIKPLKGTTTAMPEWFPNFVQQVMFKSAGKKIDADLMEYTVKELPDIRILRHDDGRVFVEGKNEYGKAYSIEYEPPGYELYDEKTGKAFKKQGDFVAEEEVPVNMDPDGNVDFDGVVLDSVDDILGSDARRMEEFTTGKPVKAKKGEMEIERAEAAYESAKEDYYYEEID